jgi:hypothetical protein
MTDEEQRAANYRAQATRRALFRQQLERTRYTPPAGPRLAVLDGWEPWLRKDFGICLPEVPIRVPLP